MSKKKKATTSKKKEKLVKKVAKVVSINQDEEEDELEAGEKLTGKQKRFCEEYIFDFNGARAARDAGYSEDTARNIASENLTKPDIQAYIAELQANMEQTSGISRLKVLREHEKLAFSSIAHLHDTWIERKDFEKLTPDQKACIAQIETQIRKISIVREGQPEQDIETEFVKLKLYDKQKSLDAISKILGFESAKKVDFTTKGDKLETPSAPVIQYFNNAPPLAGSEEEIETEKK